MSAERAALRIVKLAKLGTEQTGKPFGSDIMADIGQTASIIREETKCDQLAEALRKMVETHEGPRMTEKLFVDGRIAINEARALLAEVDREGEGGK